MKTNSLDGEKIFKEAVKVIKEDIPKPNKEGRFCNWIKENGS